jgi:hypothetical protein
MSPPFGEDAETDAVGGLEMLGDALFVERDEELSRPTHTNAGREPADRRRHKTYDRDHWETAHVRRVDKVGAYENVPCGDGPIRSRERIRVDLDGFGHGRASMHAPGENLQVSFWLTPTTARKLADDLQELADGMEVDQ